MYRRQRCCFFKKIGKRDRLKREAPYLIPLYLPAEYHVDGGLHPAALRAMVRELVGASELVGFELTEFEAPVNPEHRASAVQAVIRMIEPVLLVGPDRGKRVYEPGGGGSGPNLNLARFIFIGYFEGDKLVLKPAVEEKQTDRGRREQCISEDVTGSKWEH
jgi:hypothetical protein